MIRALHHYWQRLGDGQVPERRQIDPATLKPLLPYLELVEFEDAPFRIRYRLTGTQIDRWNGFNITGRYLDEFATLDLSGSVGFLLARYAECWRSGEAFIGCHDWPRALESAFGPAAPGHALGPSSPDGIPLHHLRIWVGAFPLRIGTRIRQCLVIEDYEGLSRAREAVPWIDPDPDLPQFGTHSPGMHSSSPDLGRETGGAPAPRADRRPNGQQRDDRKRDGPERDGHARDSHGRDSHARDGRERNGPERDGHKRDEHGRGWRESLWLKIGWHGIGWSNDG